MGDLWGVVGGISAALAAAAVIAGWVRSSKWAKSRATTHGHLQLFLLDWLGETPRPGFEGRPSFPERMGRVERRTEVLQHDFATEMVSRLTLIGDTVDEIKTQSSETTSAVARLDFRVNGIDARILDHKRRNEEQSDLLRQDLERRAAAQQVRNEAIETQLSHISDDLLRAEAMRAALVELGLPIDERDH